MTGGQGSTVYILYFIYFLMECSVIVEACVVDLEQRQGEGAVPEIV
jgi:hypothetical protein